jgi:hypothetical protein
MKRKKLRLDCKGSRAEFDLGRVRKMKIAFEFLIQGIGIQVTTTTTTKPFSPKQVGVG